MTASGGGPTDAEPVPVAVLTGFLGAGKTTLLNRLLGDPALADTAVIVNEFGEVGLDHLMIEPSLGDMLVLTTGCICCAARGDLLAAIESLMERRRSGVLRFDRIAIETTGLADPGPILNAILLGPGLAGAVRIDGILTLVSAVDGEATLDRHDEARRQVALADRILITKTDLVAGGAAERLRARLIGLNPSASVEEAGEAATPLHFASASVAGSIPPTVDHHRHHAAEARIRAVVLEAGQVDAAHLGRFIAMLQDRHGTALLRLKGIAVMRHDPGRPSVVQAVGHLLHPAAHLSGSTCPDHRTRLVAILDGVDPTEVAALWDGFFGPPAIDRPDAAALMGEGGAGLFG